MEHIKETFIKLFQKYIRIGKFLIAGGTASVTNLATFIVLTEFFGVWYLMASVSSYIVSFFVNFYMQRAWTFKNKANQVHAQMGLFFANSLLNLVLNTAIMYGMVDIIGVHPIISQTFVIGLLAIMNYTIYRLIIFREPKPQIEEETI